MTTQEANIQIAELRSRMNIKPLTQEELRLALDLLRKSRGQAHATSEKSRTAKSKVPINSDALLGELDDL